MSAIHIALKKQDCSGIPALKHNSHIRTPAVIGWACTGFSVMMPALAIFLGPLKVCYLTKSGCVTIAVANILCCFMDCSLQALVAHHAPKYYYHSLIQPVTSWLYTLHPGAFLQGLKPAPHIAAEGMKRARSHAHTNNPWHEDVWQ